MRVRASQRRLIFRLAGGCCEYCRIGIGDSSADFHIDHIIAVKHGGDNSSDNLCLACVECNIFKGDNVASFDPLTGEPGLLYHPRTQTWDGHFEINPDASISGRTPEGRATIVVLRINEASRVEQRANEMLLGNYPCQNNPSP